MKLRKTWQIVLIVFVCIWINFFGKLLAESLRLPVWFDSLGIVFTAYLYGAIPGAIVGLTSSLLYSFVESTALAYSFTAVAIGLFVGWYADRKPLHDLFGTVSLSVLLTAVSVAISTPINILQYKGLTGNLWGDGVIHFFIESHWNKYVCFVLGEFFIDFLDKMILALVAWGIVHLARKTANRKKVAATVAALLVILVTVSVLLSGNVWAGETEETETEAAVQSVQIDNHFKDYIQTIYDGQSGIPGTTVNDITSTKDGILWIGSYSGLYRYNGSEFKFMDQFSSVKNVNCFYSDDFGRLWIGTNDSGVSVCINGEIHGVLDTEYGLPNDTIQSMTSDNQGNFYIGTSDSVGVVSMDGGLQVIGVLDEIKYARSMDHNEDGLVAMVSDEGLLYLVQGQEILDSAAANVENLHFNSCGFDSQGNLYAGLSDSELYVFSTTDRKLKQTGSINCAPLENIQKIEDKGENIVYLCSDTGVGYLDENGEFRYINTNSFDSSIDSMEVDYQGNIWFTSSRQGMLKLSKSPFTELFSSAGLSAAVVNTEVKWNDRMYFGTDSGMTILDVKDRAVTDDPLLNTFAGIRIRGLFTDSKNNLWVCTHGQGLQKVDPKGNITVYDSTNGMDGDKFRCIVELSDGTIAAAGDAGVAYIEKGKITDKLGRDQGMTSSKSLSLEKTEDDSLYVGTDGGGVVYINKDRQVEAVYNKNNSGLSSDVVMRTVSLQGVDRL